MRFKIPDFPLGALLATTLCVLGLLFISPETPSMWLWEALIAISFIVWSLGAGFLASKEVTKSEENKVDGPAKASPAQQNPKQISPDIAALIDAIKAEGRSNRKEERKEDHEGKIRDQITIVFLGITMFAIILQVHEMVKAYEPIHEQAQAAEGQATAAIKQAAAAATQAQGVKDQTEAAKQTALAAREGAIAAGRAWVGPSGATMNSPPVINQDSKILITYQNTGREPAVGFVPTSDVFVVETNETSLTSGSKRIQDDLAACLKLQPVIGSQVVFPSVGFGGNQFTLTVPKRIIDDKVVNGPSFIVATGCFAYMTFNQTHRSAFCFLYGKAVTSLPNINFCGSGGYAD